MSKKALFPSEEWIKDYCTRLSDSREYNRSGQGWKDPIQFKITDIDSIDLKLDFKSFILNLKDGKCMGYQLVRENRDDAPFVLNATYSNWKRILEGKVNPTQAMLSGILKVKGDVAVLLKYAVAATEMVKAGQGIDTEFKA
jgi:putative sterol carrier protein